MCILSRARAWRARGRYGSGLLLKINLKLAGHNVYASGGLGLLRDTPTIVFGVDVNHPQPGSTKPSFAAICATMDQECAEYFTSVKAVGSRTEISQDGFQEEIRKAIVEWYNKNGQTRPQRIIFYRDGVANNQFDEVEEKDVKAVEAACRECGADYLPEIVFIVVQQRTPCRLAQPQGASFGQVQAGTVVDTGSTQLAPHAALVLPSARTHSPRLVPAPSRNGSLTTRAPSPLARRAPLSPAVVTEEGKDFYFVSQHGLKGTARPTHYHIIRNDPRLSLHEIERLTFDLCFLYARATKIVSRAAPVYYAHRAAFLAQYYDEKYKEVNNERWETGSVTSQTSNGSGSQGQLPEIKLHHDIARRVYFA